MKKILTLLLILLVIGGCSNNEEPKDENAIDYTYDIISRDVDMSEYDGVNSTDHVFKAITVDQLFNCIDSKSSGVFYLGRTNCGCCQTCVSYLNNAAQELDVTIYYMDVYDELMPITDKETMDKLRTYMSDILITNEEGEKELQTPTVFTVINGEFGDYIICLGSYTFDNPPTKFQESRLINRYKEILKPFSSLSQD